MQISGLSSSAQTLLTSNGQNLDGSRQTSGAVDGTESTQDSTQLTGSVSSSDAVQPVEESVEETTVTQQTAAAQTQVVTSADETLGTTLGVNVNTYA